MNNLWPEDICVQPVTTPLSPAQEQAAFLSQITGGVVTAEVIPVQGPIEDEFSYDFDLVVSSLRYRFTLFSVRFQAIGYPADILPYGNISDELGIEVTQGFTFRERIIQVNDEAQMTAALEAILRSATTKQIVQTLLAQARQLKHSRRKSSDTHE